MTDMYLTIHIQHNTVVYLNLNLHSKGESTDLSSRPAIESTTERTKYSNITQHTEEQTVVRSSDRKEEIHFAQPHAN
jgi:hypothetical protein